MADEEQLIAPCGIHCAYCYAYLRKKNHCPGCYADDKLKPKSCRNCFKKNCVREKGISYCIECDVFPCQKMKYFNKRYKTRYRTDLIAGLEIIKNEGKKAFLEAERKRLSCPECGGKINLHTKECQSCGKSGEY